MAKSINDQVKEAFVRVTHKQLPIIEEDTDQVYDWSLRHNPKNKIYSPSLPTSPRHSYIDRQEKLEKEKKAFEIKNNMTDSISNSSHLVDNKGETKATADSEFLRTLKEFLEIKQLKKQINNKAKTIDNPFLEESVSKNESLDHQSDKHEQSIMKVNGIHIESPDT